MKIENMLLLFGPSGTLEMTTLYFGIYERQFNTTDSPIGTPVRGVIPDGVDPIGACLGKSVSPTDFGFTGQRNEGGFGLYDYNARMYSPRLGRFVSPDSIVPDPSSSADFNRYRYSRNSPLNFVDPSGHCSVTGESADDIEGNATGSDGLCWSIFYTLQQQGIPGLDYRWNYAIDKEWITKNRINYRSSGTPPRDSPAPTQGAGYQLLTYGGQAALINGEGVYHVYLDEYGGSITAGIVAGQFTTVSSAWIAHDTYQDQRRYESKLVPYNVGTDGNLQNLIKGVNSYRQQVNDLNMTRLQLGHTASSVFAAGVGVAKAVKEGISGLASAIGLTADLTTLGSTANDVYQNQTKTITTLEELYELFDKLPEID